MFRTNCGTRCIEAVEYLRRRRFCPFCLMDFFLQLDQLNSSRETPPKVFGFDTVFAPEARQMDVYNRVARPIVDNVLEGYNGTIFAYGQTGTGKTFTMEGDRTVAELKGIIPNSFAHIFGHIAKAEDNLNFLVRVSYLEIYNEEVGKCIVVHAVI